MPDTNTSGPASGKSPPHEKWAGLMARFSTPDLSDALDVLGIEGTPLGLRPVWLGCPRISGPAYTLSLSHESGGPPAEGTLRAVAAAAPGDVLVVENGDDAAVNSWGGMVSKVAVRRGLAGAVLGGACRDVEEIEEAGFPVYSLGVVATSVRGRTFFRSHGDPIRLGGVRVQVGDWVTADRNGVVVVPAGVVDGALRGAERALQRERKILDAIGAGVDASEAHRDAGYEF